MPLVKSTSPVATNCTASTWTLTRGSVRSKSGSGLQKSFRGAATFAVSRLNFTSRTFPRWVMRVYCANCNSHAMPSSQKEDRHHGNCRVPTCTRRPDRVSAKMPRSAEGRARGFCRVRSDRTGDHTLGANGDGRGHVHQLHALPRQSPDARLLRPATHLSDVGRFDSA